MGLPWWGLPAPDETVAWGARAIDETTGGFSLLWDRQSWTLGSNQSLAKKLNGGALIKAQEEWARLKLSGEVSSNQPKRVRLVDEDVIIEADSRGSCGYVYLIAWEQP